MGEKAAPRSLRASDQMPNYDDFEELYGKWEHKLYQAAMAQTDRHFALP